jgi:hypothetical protein
MTIVRRTGLSPSSSPTRWWLGNSPSHNDTMLDGRYRVIGIAQIHDPDSVHGWYWTMDLGGVLGPPSTHRARTCGAGTPV